MKPPRRYYIYLALFTVAATLLASELLVRAWRWASPSPKVRIYRENPHGTGSYRLKPDFDITTRAGGRRVRIRTNSLGMAWREARVEKPAHVRRIAFVGDSFTFGLWADSFERSFAGVFDATVAPSGFEVLNFGVPGYGMGDVKLQMEEEVLRFVPDDVILVFYTGNDFADTYLGIRKYDVVDGRVKLNDAIVREKVPAQPGIDSNRAKKRAGVSRRVKKWVKAHSVLYKFLAGMRTPPVRTDFRSNPNFLGRTYWCSLSYPVPGDRAVRVTLETLGGIADLCARHRIRLLIAAMPVKDQVYSERERGKDFDIYRPQGFLRDFARERGIPFLDLVPAMRRGARGGEERLYVPGEVHLSNEGHAVAGKALAEWFEALERKDHLKSGGTRVF